MNLLLDAYFDINYGDDLFVETITGMFPECKFYSFLEYFPPRVSNWAEKLPNLYLLPECGVFLQKNLFDAYLCVGGDIFPDGGDYTKRKAYVESVKQGNGVVAFLGFSLFHNYCEETKRDLTELMEMADLIAPRDEASARMLRQLLPNRDIHSMADLAFASQWQQQKPDRAGNRLLGISVRTPNYADEESMERYCDALAGVISTYLQENSSGRVRMLCLSDGSSVDAQAAEVILGKLQERARTERVVYMGDTDAFKRALAECDLVICTRLHAMISCIAMNIPFLPIIYEVKMEHILEEIHYTGDRFFFDKLQNEFAELTKSVMEGVKDICWDEESTKAYLDRSENVFKSLRHLVMSKQSRPIVKTDVSHAVCPEKEYGRAQAQEVEKKNEELGEMAETIQKQQESLEECQSIIAGYLKTIEEINRQNGDYFNLIEELNGNISGLSKEIENLVQEKNSRDEILRKIKPFFVSKTGSALTKMTGSLMRSEELKADWAAIQQYFS